MAVAKFVQLTFTVLSFFVSRFLILLLVLFPDVSVHPAKSEAQFKHSRPLLAKVAFPSYMNHREEFNRIAHFGRPAN